MMKKIVSLFLAVLMIASCGALFSCGKDKTDVYELYRNGVEKTNGLKSYVSDAKISQTISIDLGGGSSVDTSTVTESRTKLRYGDDGTMYSESHGTVSTDAYGEVVETPFDLFTDGDFFYYRQDGEEDYAVIAKDGPEADSVASYIGNLANQKIELFEKDDIASSSVTAKKGADTTVTLTIKKDSYNEKIDDLIGSMLSSYESMGAEVTKCEVTEDPVLVYTVAGDGYLSGIDTSFEMVVNMNVSGINIAMTLTQTAVTGISEPNGDVEIVFPNADGSGN